MGFVWWSLRRKEDRVYLILDGVDLDMKTKGNFIWVYFVRVHVRAYERACVCVKRNLKSDLTYLISKISILYMYKKIDELYFRPLEFGIDNMLGHIVDLKKEDYLCVEVSNLNNVLLT